MAENTPQSSPATGPGPIAPASLTAPSERPAAPREQAPSSGGGLGKLIFVLRMLWYLIWNLPGFLNIMSALKLKTRRSCTIRGYSKSIYLYPLIPTAGIMTLLSNLEGSSSPLGIAYTLMLFLVFVLVTEDVKGRNAVAAIAVLFGLGALYAGLVVAGYDVNHWVTDALGYFAPAFNPGSAMLLAALSGVLVTWSYIKAGFSSCIQVQGNQYITIEVHQKTPYPADEWRLRARVSDWLERIWMGADDLFILSNWGSGREHERDQSDAWDKRVQYTLHNVPGARIVEDLVYAANSVLDVEPTSGIKV